MKKKQILKTIGMGVAIATSAGLAGCGDASKTTTDKNDNKAEATVEAENKKDETVDDKNEDNEKEDNGELMDKKTQIVGSHVTYVLKEYVDAKTGEVTNAPSGLNLRTEPVIGAPVLGVLPNGTKVTVIGVAGDWYKVVAEGETGFVHSNYLTVEGIPYTFNPAANIETNKKPNVTIKNEVVQNNTSKPSQSVKPSTPSDDVNQKPSEDKDQQIPSVINSVPSITGQGVSIVADKNAPAFDVSLLKLRAEDKEDGDLTKKIEITFNNVDTRIPGEYRVEAKVTDNQGATKKISLAVIVTAPVSDEAPVITANDVTITEGTVFDYKMCNASAYDKEDGDITNKLVFIGGDLDPFNTKPGTYTGQFSVVDSNGNTTVKEVKITVTAKPIIAPEINSIPVISGHDVELTVGDTFNISMLNLAAQDEEEGDLTRYIEVVKDDVNTEVAGVYTVKVKVEDSEGATATASFKVTVKAKAVTPPSLINHAPTISANDIEINEGEEFTLAQLGIVANDKEEGSLTDKVKVIEGSVDTEKPGSYELTLAVSDSKGATAKIKVTVTVKKVPNTPPVIEGHDATVEVGTVIDASLFEIYAHDKEDGTIGYRMVNSTVIPNTPGEYEVTYEAEDSKGAVTTRTFKLTVVAKNTAPIITGKDLSIRKGDHFTLAMLDIKATDAEDGDLEYEVVKNNVDPNTIGSYEVVVKATDEKGETTTKTFKVEVTKTNTAPVIMVQNSVVTLTEGDKWDLSLHGVTAKDTEDGDVSTSITVSGELNTDVAGTYTLTCTAVDEDGNKATATLSVIVKAKINALPVLTAQDVTIKQGQTYDTSMGNPKAMDVEEGDISDRITATTDVNTKRPGTYTTTYNVADKKGGTATCTVKVIVEAVAPTITATNAVIDAGTAISPATFKASAVDANGVDISSKLEILGDYNVNQTGVHKITLRVMDDYGNVSSTIVELTVNAVATGYSCYSEEFRNIVTQEMYRLVNEHRVANGKAPYITSAIAQKCATGKSQHMADNNYFDHAYEGKYFWEMSPEYEDSDICSENIAKYWIRTEYKYTEEDCKGVAKQFFTLWKNSSGHNANMLDDYSTEIGFGIAVDASGAIYGTQQFVQH